MENKKYTKKYLKYKFKYLNKLSLIKGGSNNLDLIKAKHRTMLSSLTKTLSSTRAIFVCENNDNTYTNEADDKFTPINMTDLAKDTIYYFLLKSVEKSICQKVKLGLVSQSMVKVGFSSQSIDKATYTMPLIPFIFVNSIVPKSVSDDDLTFPQNSNISQISYSDTVRNRACFIFINKLDIQKMGKTIIVPQLFNDETSLSNSENFLNLNRTSSDTDKLIYGVLILTDQTILQKIS